MSDIPETTVHASLGEASQAAAVAADATSTNENKWSKNGYGQSVPRSTGKFSASETALVRQSIEEYCASRGIEPSKLCSECDHKAELKGAWMEIARALPHRTVQSVYRHGLRQLHPFKRGRWTEEECQTLLDLVMRLGKKWSTIQNKLDRSADSCRDKYREMSVEYVKGRWKESETLLLQSVIREHLRVDPNMKMRELGKKVEREGIVLPWSEISKRMGKRSRLSCFKKWQKMTTAPSSSGGTSSGSGRRKGGRTAANGDGDGDDDEDGRLLAFLSESGAPRVSDVAWSSSGYHEGDPLERWGDLMENYVPAEMFDLPVWQLARYVIDKRTILASKDAAVETNTDDEAEEEEENSEEVQAKIAAATVEAVGIPEFGGPNKATTAASEDEEGFAKAKV